MTLRPNALLTSPQQADPLSWIVSFNLSLTASAAALVGGVGVSIVIASQGVPVIPIVVATLIATAACLLVMRASEAHRPAFRSRQAALPFGLGVLSVGVSALAHRGSEVALHEWTGPLALCVVLVALVPYCSPVVLAAQSVVGASVTAVFALWAFPETDLPFNTFFVATASYPLHVGVTGAAFSAMVVAGVARWRALPYDQRESPREQSEAFSSRLQVHGAPIVIGDDVLNLLERVADGARLTAKERAEAADLAQDIRADLVTVANRNWLDAMASRERVAVVDPEQVANRLTRDQRAVIRRIVLAALESPLLSGELVRIELRAMPDGATAVALTMDITLPEGRRIMMLAPQFVSLKTSVKELEWDADETLRMRFKLPPANVPTR